MIHTFKVAATLAAMRIVSGVTGTGFTVQYPPNAASFHYGVTTDQPYDTVSSISVATAGERAKLFFNDTVTSGQPVGADTSGRGVPIVMGETTAANTLTVCTIGPLIGKSVASTGTLAEILVQPGYLKGTR
jgi:hypothetical protein